MPSMDANNPFKGRVEIERTPSPDSDMRAKASKDLRKVVVPPFSFSDTPTPKPTRRPLTSRPLDFVYFCFFASHIPASLLIDFQAIYPPSLVPELIAKLPELYIRMSNDPLIGGALGYMSNAAELGWFKSFLMLELLFQFPVFFLGLRGLWNDSRGIYPLLLVYAASTATTTLPCLALILSTPITDTVAQGVVSITTDQRALLLSSYVPFFLIPLCMTVDMAFRVARLVSIGAKAEQVFKRR